MSMTPPGSGTPAPFGSLPPPPPSMSTAPGAPPAPTFGAPPPPGYVAYRPGVGSKFVSLQKTEGLRKAAVILFWVSVAVSASISAALFWRRGVWTDFLGGNAGLSDLDDADIAVAGLTILNGIVVLTAAIVLAIWSLRLVRNAEQFAGTGLKPGLACGGWFIPIGNFWVPFVRLRATMSTFRGDDAPITRWQAGFCAMLVANNILQRSFRLDSFDQDKITSTLGNQATFSVVSFAIAAVTAFLGMRAMRSLDAGLASRHEAHLAAQAPPPASAG